MLHPHTLPAAAGQCYSNITADRTDGRRDVRRAWWSVCVWWEEGRADARAGGRVRLTAVPARLSPTTPPSARRRLTGAGARGAGARTDGRTGGRPGARRRSLVAGVRLRTKTTLLQYYEQFHAVTK